MSDADTGPLAGQEYVRENGIEMAALRKLIFQMAGDPEDASLMEAALIAIEEWQDVQDRLEKLERLQETDDEEVWP